MHRKAEEIMEALRTSGETVRCIASRLGVCVATVERYGVSVVRSPCGCGRSAGHRGHCSYRWSVSGSASSPWWKRSPGRLVWTSEASAILRADYPAGVRTEELIRRLSVVMKYAPSAGAVWAQAEKLGLRRPGWFRGMTGGRPIGSKNKHPYVRVGWRPTKSRLEAVASEADEVFAYLIYMDGESDRLAFYREMRWRREQARFAYRRLVDAAKAASELALAARHIEKRDGEGLKTMAAPIRWTTEARCLVHQLWEEGRSSSDIAIAVGDVLGCLVSVRAVTAQARTSKALRPSEYLIEQARIAGRKGGMVLGPVRRRLGPSEGFVHPSTMMELAMIRRLERGPVDHGNVLPTVRSDPSLKDVPYKMASSGPDPFREVRRRQAQRGSVGRL